MLLTVAIIQARMSSRRLPGKVLAEIAGQPMLQCVVQRVRAAQHVHQIVVATSTAAADDAIAEFCVRHGLTCYRGDENDVLDRFYQAARLHHADIIVRLTADCPLLDPRVIDRVIAVRAEQGADYAANVLQPTCPDGLDVEVFTFAALERAWREASKPSEREHVTPYLRCHDQFQRINVEFAFDPEARDMRWTVDEPRDLEFVRAVYAAFNGTPHFGTAEVLALLRQRPDIRRLQNPSLSNEGYYKSLYDQAIGGAAPKRPLAQSQAWFARAQKVIPGASQTFSRALRSTFKASRRSFWPAAKGAVSGTWTETSTLITCRACCPTSSVTRMTRSMPPPRRNWPKVTASRCPTPWKSSWPSGSRG